MLTLKCSPSRGLSSRSCRHGLAINPTKTTADVFSSKLLLDILRLTSLNGVKIQLANEVKYLGVIFDHRLYME